MKHVYYAALLIAAVGSQCSASTSVVVPSEFANAEAPDGTRGGFVFQNGYRLQGIFDASVFESLPESDRLMTGFLGRPDGLLGRANSVDWPHFRLMMSTTSVTPATLSNEFAANLGTDATVVYEGPLTLSTENLGPGGGPKEFDIAFGFQIPFYYDPAEGNLLMDWTVEGPADWVGDDRVNADIGTTAWISNVNRNSPTANQRDVGTPVLRFTFVPEPSSATLLCIGFLAAFGTRRKMAS